MDKKYYILTFGCQANERDSETLAGILQKQDMFPPLNYSMQTLFF